MIRLALLEHDVAALSEHLRAAAPKEEGAFLLLRRGQGARGERLVASGLLLPPAEAWERQAEGQLRPSAQWLSAVISAAVSAESGLLFVHSHPDARHPAHLSLVDEVAVEALGRTMDSVLDGPFAAAVVHESSWAGVVWRADRLEPIGRITSEGLATSILSPRHATPIVETELDARQRDALGAAHERLRELSVGIVGCGGLGSPIAEQLVRMGIGELTLVDDDELDTDSNVRRVFGSTAADLSPAVAPAKVDVVGRHLDGLGLGTAITRIKADVRTRQALQALLDCDVVIGGTDTHGSRALLNDLPGTYLLPVIDVGVRVAARGSGDLAGLVAELRLLTPSRPCLWCRGDIDADVIRAENLPPSDRENLEYEGYVVGSVGQPAPSVTALTVLGAAMAACGLIGLISSEGPVMPSGWLVDGLYGDARETGTEDPVPTCRCRSQLAGADTRMPPLQRDERTDPTLIRSRGSDSLPTWPRR